MRMAFKKLNGFCIIISSLIIISCGSSEEKKIEFFERGKALYEKGDYVEARLEFKNAIQLAPEFSEAYYMLGMAEFEQRNLRQAYRSF